MPSAPLPPGLCSQPDAIHLSKEDFVFRFLRWLQEQGYSGRTDWDRIVHLSYEFAEYYDLAAISPMALSKALAPLGLATGQRYLDASERGYKSQLDRGCVRPRRKWIDLQAPAQAVADLLRFVAGQR